MSLISSTAANVTRPPRDALLRCFIPVNIKRRKVTRNEQHFSRNGFTLIELLVVIAIIAVLTGLLLPAIQKVREAAVRTQCGNNLKQIGIATQSYYDVNKALPPAWIGDNSGGNDGWASWAVLLLPHLEQTGQYSRWDLRYPASKQPPEAYQVQVPVYLCPGRPAPVWSVSDFASPGGGLGDYNACYGSEDVGPNKANGAIIPNANPGATVTTDGSGNPVVLSWQSQVNFLTITDGASNTFMFGEKHIRPNSLRGKNEDRSIFGGQNNSIRRIAGIDGADQRPLRAPNDQNGALANQSFGGPHFGVCQFVFCDGAVRAVPLSVSIQTLTYLANRNDGQPLGSDY